MIEKPPRPWPPRALHAPHREPGLPHTQPVLRISASPTCPPRPPRRCPPRWTPPDPRKFPLEPRPLLSFNSVNGGGRATRVSRPLPQSSKKNIRPQNSLRTKKAKFSLVEPQANLRGRSNSRATRCAASVKPSGARLVFPKRPARSGILHGGTPRVARSTKSTPETSQGPLNFCG